VFSNAQRYLGAKNGVLLLITLSLFILGCKPPAPAASALSAEEEDLLCRGATSALYGTPIDIIGVKKREKDVIYTTYIRKDDKTVWENKFRIHDGTIDWGAGDGRWRTHPADDKLSYSIDRKAGLFTIISSYSDGSGSKKEFSLK